MVFAAAASLAQLLDFAFHRLDFGDRLVFFGLYLVERLLCRPSSVVSLFYFVLNFFYRLFRDADLGAFDGFDSDDFSASAAGSGLLLCAAWRGCARNRRRTWRGGAGGDG